MRSTTLVALRALIMLACLVAVPLVAVFGTSLKDWFGDSPASVSEPASPIPVAEHEPDATAYPPVEDPYVQPPVDGVPPRENLQGHSPLLAPASAGGTLAVGGRPTIVPHHPRAVVDRQEPEPAAESESRESAAPTRSVEPFPPAERQPPRYDTEPTDPRGSAAVDPELPLTNDTGLAEASDRTAPDFVQIQQRLQELGATYYRLETWGKRQLFRFHCRMSIRADSPYTRHFEATDTDPLKAMQRVLDQIETWRAEQAGQ